jgi:hypothetical protein
MVTRIAISMPWKACAAGIIATAVSVNAGISAEQDASARAVCAARELLLTTLVEAHGEVPNAASEKLAEASIMIMRARIACDEGRVKDAITVYDRLIAELGSVMTHRGQ